MAAPPSFKVTGFCSLEEPSCARLLHQKKLAMQMLRRATTAPTAMPAMTPLVGPLEDRFDETELASPLIPSGAAEGEGARETDSEADDVMVLELVQVTLAVLVTWAVPLSVAVAVAEELDVTVAVSEAVEDGVSDAVGVLETDADDVHVEVSDNV